MKKSLIVITLLSVTQSAWAHLSYSGRNFGTFTGLSDATTTISNQAVSGNYAWADGADGNLADSHKSKAFNFTLENDALITFSVMANPTATANSIDGLIPAFGLHPLC
jgi:hypothetical protein